MSLAPFSVFRQGRLVVLKTLSRGRRTWRQRPSTWPPQHLARAVFVGQPGGRPAGLLLAAVSPTPPRLTTSIVSRVLTSHPLIFSGDTSVQFFCPFCIWLFDFLLMTGSPYLLNVQAFAQRCDLQVLPRSVVSVVTQSPVLTSTSFILITSDLPN